MSIKIKIYHYTPTRVIKIKRPTATRYAITASGLFTYSVMSLENSTTTLEKVQEFLIKSKIYVLNNPAIPFLAIYLKEIKT